MGESRRRREYAALRPDQRLGDAPVDAEYYDKIGIVRFRG